ncbi:CLIP domain-containing serine protease B9-like [Onthophagus taurus]|uniref:CLIP domain-containing serine protease B9-like n=1 Tax=Onthophagus taurus TaxID=166361 RepID=UPI000C204120|nr:melanization protease 1-like [Onthophagus taurus]
MKTLLVVFGVLIQSFFCKGFVFPDQFYTALLENLNGFKRNETKFVNNSFEIDDNNNEIKQDNEKKINKYVMKLENRFDKIEINVNNLLTEDCGNVRPTWRGEERGIRQSELNEFPFYVDLIYENDTENSTTNSMHCGGTLINDRFVVTAASCIESKPNIIAVRLGDHDLDTNPDCYSGIKNKHICAPPTVDLKIENKDIIIHNLYRSNSTKPRKYDIALIRLPQKVNFTSAIEPVCLPIKESYRKQANLTLIGFPQRNKLKSRTNTLSSLTIPYVVNAHCQNLLQTSIGNDYLCANGQNLANYCQGYGGSGLFYVIVEDYRLRWILASVVSYDMNICTENYLPKVFTRVEFHNSWILENIK